MSFESLRTPSHERNASCFEQGLAMLKKQHAFQKKDRTFLNIEWESTLNLDSIEEIIDWADSEEERRLGNLARLVGHLADRETANRTIVKVLLTASSKELINSVVPSITDKVRSCGGIPGAHSLEYQSLKKEEGIPGYWFSKGTHKFE